jgi:hypothetical protein
MNPPTESDGGGPVSSAAPVPKATPAEAPPPSPNPPADPPPAAAVVLTGEKTERELQLEKDLEAERQSRKKVELDNAQLQDEVHRLTTPEPPAPNPPAPKPRPARKHGPLGIRIK